MASQRELIIAEFGTRINGGGKPVTAERTRSKAIDSSSTDVPAIVYFADVDRVFAIHASREGALPKTSPKYPVRREFDIAVACIAKAGASTTAEEELDVLTSWAVKSTCGTDWGAIAMGASEIDTDFDHETANAELAIAVVTIRVYYTSRSGDPDVRN